MYFDLTDEQQAIKATAHDFLGARFKSERVREIAASEDGTDAAGWQEMAELGWTGLAVRFLRSLPSLRGGRVRKHAVRELNELGVGRRRP